MTDITEIDDIIFGRLDSSDLARCILVNRKWHAIVAPYLWCDLSRLDKYSDTQQQAFIRLVLEDYLQEHQDQRLKADDHSTEQPTQAPSPMSAWPNTLQWFEY